MTKKFDNGHCSFCYCDTNMRVNGVIHAHGAPPHICRCIACECGLIVNPVEIKFSCSCEVPGNPCGVPHGLEADQAWRIAPAKTVRVATQ